MARILGIKDSLDEVAARYPQAPLRHPVFLNSVPKSGTHLLLNIFRMFTPPDLYWGREAIQLGNLRDQIGAFSPKDRYLSWGHLLFSDESALAVKWARHIVLVRDPYDLVLARARFYLSNEFQGGLDHIKHGAITTEQILNMMIFGIYQKTPSLYESIRFNALAWIGTEAKMVRYEDVRAHAKALDKNAERFFRDLFSFAGLEDMPGDWKERVRLGADPKQSRTARENLTGGMIIPDELPAMQKKLVDLAAPGLREFFGYK